MSEPHDPYLRVPVAGGQVLILLAAEDDPATVENCDGHLELDNGSRRTFTALTVAEISRLMARWQSTGEASDGSYLRIPDLIVLRSGGVNSIVAAVLALAEELPAIALGDE